MRWVESLIERMLQRASARAQAESVRARELLAELAGRRLAVAVQGTAWAEPPLLFESTGQALQLVRAAAGSDAPATATRAAGPAADVTISGAPLALLALTRADPQSAIQRSGLRISGDAALAQRFRELGALMVPDLEDSLSHLLGRSVAHLLMRGLRSAASSAGTALWTSARNAAEYLAHESGELVSRREAEHFLRGVEQAREQLDRLETRLARLEQHAGASPDGSEPG